MPTQVQFRRGTTAQNNNFIGAAGEIAVDLDRMVLRVHDGVTAGGTAMVTANGTVTNAVNIVGGAVGAIPYQDSVGVTKFVNIGAVGQVLSSDGTTATWVDVGSLTGGGGISADDVFVSTQTSGDRYFVVADQNGNYVALEADSGANAAVYNLATGLAVNSTLTVSKAILPSTSGIDIGSLANPFRSLYVTSGTVYIGGLAIEDISGSLTVNNQVIVTTSTIGTLVANTATNIGGGTAGQIVYQTAPGATSFAGPGNLGEIIVSGGAAAPVYTSTSSIYVGNASVADSLNSVNTSTQQVGFADVSGSLLAANTASQQVGFANIAGSLLPANTSTQYVGFANIAASVLAANTSSQQVGFAANLLGGAAGGLPYQTAADATTFLTIGAGNAVLTSNGSAPVWSTALSLSGNLTVGGNLTVNGTTTYVNSTVTNIVDPIITIGGAADGQPSPSDDNKDRGIAFRWYTSGAAKTGFFGFDDSSGFFTFVPDATISGGEVMSGTKGAANINIAGGSTGQILYQSAANETGFIGPGSAGQILVSAGSAIPVYTSTSSIFVGSAANILAGTSGQLVYQSNANTTGFVSTGTTGQLLMSNGTNAPAYQSTLTVTGGTVNVTSVTASSTTATGALVVAGGLGVGGNLNVGGTVTVGLGAAAVSSSNGDLTLAATGGNVTTTNIVIISNTTGVTSAATGALQVAGGVGVGGGLFVGGIVTATSFVGSFAGSITGVATTATNLASGTAGQVPYQTAAGATSFYGPGTLGQILVSSGASAPTYTNTASIYVGNAAVANILNAGNTSTQLVGFANVAGSLLAANTATQLVGFANVAGSLLAANTATQQVGFANVAGTILAANTGSIYVGNAAVANILNAGNTATQQVGFADVAGRLLAANTTTQYVGFANKSNNIIAGTAGQLVYQSAADTTGFVGPGTAGQLLMSNGTNAPAYQSTLTVVGGTVNVTSVTASTTTATGALVVAGGLGVGGDLNVGGTVTVGSGAASVSSTGDLTLTATGGNVTTTNIVIISNTTGVTSAATGALRVAGGVGVGGGLFVGGIVTATSFVGAFAGSITGVATTATNLQNGTAGQVPYQTAAGATSFYGPGTAGQILVSAGTSAPTYTNTASIYVGNAAVANILNAGNTSTQLVGFADNAGKWKTARTVTFTGDVTGSFTIDGSADVSAVALTVGSNTVTLGTDTTGDYVSNGATAGFGISGSTTGETQTFTVTSNATSTNATSTLVFRDSTGGFSAGNVSVKDTTVSSSTSTGALKVEGGVGIGGNLYVGGEIVAQKLTIQFTTVTTTLVQTDDVIQTLNTTQAVSTITGALQIAGGAGIGGNAYIGGNANVAGTVTHNGLVPTAGTAIDQIYTSTKSLTLTNAWQDTGISGTDLATGSYMIQVFVNDSSVGGGHINMYYTGVMSWFSTAAGENSYSEIVLNRAGNAAAAGTIFLRVAEVNLGTLKLQISGTTINSGASNYAFSFRRMI